MGDISFRNMTDVEYEKFVETSVLDYSQNLIKSGECSEENGFECAENQFKELLPQGKYTEDNFFCVVVNDENENVGVIWYRKHTEGIAFITDFLIYKQFRKKGYGRATLLLLDSEAKAKGYNKILLHVFKFNETAFSLYSSLGYKVVEEKSDGLYMVKEI